MKRIILVSLLAMFAISGFAQDNWRSIFNGKNLTGWTVKVTGYPCGGFSPH